MDTMRGGDGETVSSGDPLLRSDPRRIGEYSILARLGAGGMGTVYRGRSPGGETVAIKLVHPHLAVEAEFRDRLAMEADAGRRVPAFCSARVLATGTHQGQPYLVTDYVDGVPLSRLVSTSGAVDLPQAHALALGIAAGLAAIHNAGLVHRDVKPANVMLTVGGVRIIDFGIVRALDATQGLTRTDIVMGSLGWAAPEQLEGAAPAASMDIFSWGCVVAYAATATHPFGPGGLDTCGRRMFAGQPQLTGVPEPLLPLVARALSRDPDSRPTAEELLLALVGAAQPAPAPRREAVQVRRPRRAVAALAVGAPLAMALVIGVVISPAGDGGRLPFEHHATTAPGASGYPASAAAQQPSDGAPPPGGPDNTDPGRLPPAAGSVRDPVATVEPGTPTARGGNSAPGATTTTAATPATAPTSAEQCKNDGWRLFTDPPFKNQGDCVSYVETH